MSIISEIRKWGDPNYTSPEQKRAKGNKELNTGIGLFFTFFGVGIFIFLLLFGMSMMAIQWVNVMVQAKDFIKVVNEEKSVILTQGNYTCTGTYESCKELFMPNRNPRLVG